MCPPFSFASTKLRTIGTHVLRIEMAMVYHSTRRGERLLILQGGPFMLHALHLNSGQSIIP